MVAEVGQKENGNRADSTTGLNKRGTENYRERGRLEVERGRASYMVAEVGQQENGDRAYSTTGLNKRKLQRKREPGG